MTEYRPAGVLFDIVKEDQFGKTISLPDDAALYYMLPDQKFVPHNLDDPHHPAKVGDLVTFKKPYSSCANLALAYVSRVRTHKSRGKSNSGSRQVELLGLPCRWFSIAHFEEYQDHQTYGFGLFTPLSSL